MESNNNKTHYRITNNMIMIMNNLTKPPKNFITLGDYILKLYSKYNENNCNDLNNTLLIIFKEIAKKLIIFQKFGFIHGDFHPGNIMISISQNHKINIRFIDFGLSIIHLPSSNKTIILQAPVEPYLYNPKIVSKQLVMSTRHTKLSINNNNIQNHAKCIDLFHLLDSLQSTSEKQFTDGNCTNKAYNCFIIFIKKLISLTQINFKYNTTARHYHTSSNNFVYSKIPETSILYPTEFVKISQY
jgi:serine/threonine protein kinase